MKSFLTGVKNVLLWSYERGSWQYDVLCLLIITTIFLVPSHYFGDRDRVPAVRAKSAQQIASKSDEMMREVNAVELEAFLQKHERIELMSSPKEALVLYLRDQMKRDVSDLRYETFINAQGHLAYRVWLR
jgi:hypothetical protein